MTRHSALALVLAVPLLLGGCISDPTAPKANVTPSQSLIAHSYGATDRLLAEMKSGIDPAQPILVTTLADNDDLTASSSFGRLVSEQMASRLVASGLTVHEVKLANRLMVREGTGQLILSRDVTQLGKSSGAQAVIAGTYTVADDVVFVNTKFMRATDGKVLAAYDYTLALDANLRKLIGSVETERLYVAPKARASND
ncbi:MAG TPA: FlgO family outer membrane protein [Candidatus Omnitrophota bacterium]|nr:FlgO family outer membrane protein [Candidatus Omnitrophota bacterium]